MKKILFMGLPGSGKGTQSHFLEKKGFVHVSTGKLIRESTDPEIVQCKEEAYIRGELLADDIVLNLIKKEIETIPKKIPGYILDGAGRTIAQAMFLKENELIDTVIFFEVSKGVATRRLLNRNEGRTDDTPQAISKRFEEFNRKTKPVLEYYEKNFDFYRIDSEPSQAEIHSEVCKVLDIK
jgi:adenylate kinase